MDIFDTACKCSVLASRVMKSMQCMYVFISLSLYLQYVSLLISHLLPNLEKKSRCHNIGGIMG